MGKRPRKPRVRRWTPEDIPGVVACHRAAYPDYSSDVHYDERLYTMQFEAFPEGQHVAVLDHRVVGYATSLIVQLDDDSQRYTYDEITGAATFNSHNPSGDSLYGADIAVHPDCRGQGIAGLLYGSRTALVKRYNLRRMIAYGRIPGYNEVAGRMTAEEYVDLVTRGDLKDSALTAHLKAGYRVKGVMLDYVPDKSSLNYATLLEWLNPNYDSAKRKIAAAPLQRVARKMRVCAAQFLMRRISTWEEFEQTVSFFVDSADVYHCHVLVLPEYFTAQLISTLDQQLEFCQTVDRLAAMSDRILEMLRQMATEHKIYIVAGTHPMRRANRLYNVAHLVTPSGELYSQDKLHITPTERKEGRYVDRVETRSGLGTGSSHLSRHRSRFGKNTSSSQVRRDRAGWHRRRRGSRRSPPGRGTATESPRPPSPHCRDRQECDLDNFRRQGYDAYCDGANEGNELAGIPKEEVTLEVGVDSCPALPSLREEQRNASYAHDRTTRLEL